MNRTRKEGDLVPVRAVLQDLAVAVAVKNDQEIRNRRVRNFMKITRKANSEIFSKRMKMGIWFLIMECTERSIKLKCNWMTKRGGKSWIR